MHSPAPPLTSCVMWGDVDWLMSPKIHSVKPSPPVWPVLEIVPLGQQVKLNEAKGWGPNPVWSGHLQQEEETPAVPACTEKGRVRTRWEGGCQQAKESSLWRNQTCRHLGLGFPASRTVRNTFLLFKPLGLWCVAMAAIVNYYRRITKSFQASGSLSVFKRESEISPLF